MRSSHAVPSRRSLEETERADRMRQVAALHLAKMPNIEIARQLKITSSTVSKYVARVRAEWAAEAREDIAHATTRELRSLDADEVKLRAAMSDGAAATDLEMRLKVYDRILKIVELRCRLLGIAPSGAASSRTRVAIAGADGNGAVQVEIVHSTGEEDWRVATPTAPPVGPSVAIAYAEPGAGAEPVGQEGCDPGATSPPA